MDQLQLLIDLHSEGLRQGPGGDAETRLAVALSGLRAASHLRVADIGCGTGASTLVLAKELGADVTAITFLPEFLAKLDACDCSRKTQAPAVRDVIRAMTAKRGLPAMAED